VSVTRYSCMLRCWDADQDSRPDFTSLVRVLGDFLESGVRQVTVTDFVVIRCCESKLELLDLSV